MDFVTQSEIKTFRQCRRKWDLRYRQGIVQKPSTIEKLGVLFFGNVVHEGLKLHYQGRTMEEIHKDVDLRFDKAIEKMPQIDNLETEEQRELAKRMLSGYAVTFATEDRAYKHIDPEQEFFVPFGPGFPMFAGKVDGIAQDQDGGYWLKEHKTADQVGEDYFNMLKVDIQHPLYMWAVEIHLGIEIKGVIYNVLRKSAPEEPELLKTFEKDGTPKLSKAQKENVTYDSYIAALQRRGIDPVQYGYMEHLEGLRERDALGNRFFYRRYIFNDRAKTDQIVREAKLTAKEIKMARENELAIYPNPVQMNCRGCPYFKLSASWHDRAQVKDLLDLMYDRIENTHVELSAPSWLF